MHAEATLDPSDLSTRKVERMSDLVAEMVLDACADDDEASAAALADLIALQAARDLSIAPALDADIDVELELDDLDIEVVVDEDLGA